MPDPALEEIHEQLFAAAIADGASLETIDQFLVTHEIYVAQCEHEEEAGQ